MRNEKLQIKIKNTLVSYWPILCVFFIWFIFSFPYFFLDKVPYSSTYQVNHFAPWNAYEKFWGPVKNGAMPDVTSQIYPWKHFTIDTWKSGQIPLWNPYSFSGTPHLANYQSAVLSPLNALFFFFPFIDAWSIMILLQPLLAGVFMYIFCRSILLRRKGSLVSSISFMFCGFLTVWMGYGTLGYAIIFLPLSLFAVEEYSKSSKSRFLIILLLSVPLSFLSGHFQTSLYFLILLLLYSFYKSLQLKSFRFAIFIFSFILLGVLLSAPQLFPSIESYKQSLRSNVYQKNEVIPWEYLPTIVSPDFFGNPVTRNDWFGHYAEWNGYIGVLSFLLACFVFLKKKSSVAIFFISTSILTFLLAFDSPLLDLLVSLKIPVLSTSSASRIIVLYSFSMAILAGMGLDMLASELKERRFKKIAVWMFFSAMIFLSLWVVILTKTFLPHDKISIARSNLLLPTALFLFLTLLIIISIFLKKKKFISLLISVLVLVVAFDALRFAMKWQAFDSRHLLYPQTSVSQAFNKISGYERVVGNFGAEAAVYYRLPSVEGYDALYNRRYGEFIASLSDGKMKDSYRSIVLFAKDTKFTPRAIQLLGVKYVVHKRSDDFVSWTFPYWKYPNDQFKLIWEDSKYQIYENTNRLPRMFIVGSYSLAKDPQQIIDGITSEEFNPSEEIVLEEEPNVYDVSSNGNVRITEYTPNIVKAQINTMSNGILYLSDSYDPGWKAFVDNKEVPIQRANYAFRAIVVPAGNHTVTFSYMPESFRNGLLASALGAVCSLVLLYNLRAKKTKPRAFSKSLNHQ